MNNDHTVEENSAYKSSVMEDTSVVSENSIKPKKKHRKKTKKIITVIASVVALLLVAITTLLVVAVILFIPSKESKIVSDEIDNLTEISFDNYEELVEVQEKYNSLSQIEKFKVFNYGKFEDTIEMFCIFVDSSIEVQSENLNELSYDILLSCKTTYEKMPEEHKQLITNSELMYDLLDEAKKLKVDSIIKEIKNSSSSTVINEKLNAYRDLLSMEEYIECLSHYARWEAFNKAEKKLINGLRDPYSYTRYSGHTTLDFSDGEGDVIISITYGARNGFGGMVKDVAVGSASFSITSTGTLIWGNVIIF